MIRFEIQELLNQSDWGVTYLAYDKQDQCDIALRRYMPLGRDGTLDEQQIREYDQRCIRLSRIEHPNLRAVIQGSVDRIDSTPYLATEWVDGKPLDELLAGEKLDAPTAMDLAKSALKVSLALSNTFGEEAIWIDTDPNSIIVGSEASNRGFTFWICLSRWFGMQPGERSVASVATMIEKLVGWDTQVYSKESGGGLGAWAKKVKGSPDIGVQEALDVLEELSGGKSKRSSQKRTKKWLVTPPPSPKRAKPRQNPKPAPAPAAAAPNRLSSQASPFLTPPRGVKPTQPVQTPGGARVNLAPRPVAPTQQLPAPTALPKPVVNSSSGSSMPMVVAIACIACLVGIAYLVKRNQDRMLEELSNNSQTASSGDSDGDTSDGDPARSQNPSSAVETPSDAATPDVRDSSVLNDSGIPIITPLQTSKARDMKLGEDVILRGTLRNVEVERGKNKERIILSMIDPADDNQVTASCSQTKDKGSKEPYERYLGRNILVKGNIKAYKDKKKGITVQFTGVNDIYLEQAGGSTKTQAPPVSGSGPSKAEPSTPSSTRKMFTPDDVVEINNTPEGTPAELRGVLHQVLESGDHTILSFDDRSVLHVEAFAYQGKFKGSRSRETFEPYIGREIIVEGHVGEKENRRTANNLQFTSLDQIRLVGEEPAKNQEPEPKPAAPEPGADASLPKDVDKNRGEENDPRHEAVEPPAQASGVPVFACNQTKAIREHVGKTVVLKGRLTEVFVRGKGGNMVLELIFEAPAENKLRIYGRASKVSFEGDFTPEPFRDYIGKEISIEGTFMMQENLGSHSHFVEFTRSSQVRLSED